MSELVLLVREAAALRRTGKPFLLATVVAVSGSSYRRPGARMIVADDRWIAGSVSGGCLEGDVVRRGEHRIRHGAPVVVTYDSTSDDDIGWGFGLGCNGVAEVLLERVAPSTLLDPLTFAGECLAGEARGALVTVFRSTDDTAPVGARLTVSEKGPLVSTIAHGDVRDALEAAAQATLRGAATTIVMVDGVAALVEAIMPPPRLFICGVGHDAVPLVALARSMGWRTTVSAPHASVATRRRFANADRILTGPAEALTAAVGHHVQAFAVVMSHDYERDCAYLRALLKARVNYIGVLGPARRTGRMLAELSRAGVIITDHALSRLHAPVGLDLGAETPQEIALAVVSEVQAAITRAPARRLRERAGPIHPSEAAEQSQAEAT